MSKIAIFQNIRSNKVKLPEIWFCMSFWAKATLFETPQFVYYCNPYSLMKMELNPIPIEQLIDVMQQF